MRTVSFLLLIITFTFANAQSNKQKGVRSNWGKYKSAILEKRGNEAVEFISSSTIKYYHKLLALAFYGDSTSVDTLQIFDKVAVFTFRIKIPLEDVVGLDASGFFTYCTNKGLINNDNVTSLDIGDIEINKKVAKAQVIRNGTESNEYLIFYKEGRIWKVDFTSQLVSANQQIGQKVARRNVEPNRFIYALLERMYGEYSMQDIWQPMRENR